MVHDGRDEEGLVVGFTWYMQMFADLLAAMDASVDADGDNLLDTSCVVLVTEFGNGAGHNTNKLPVIIAGSLGPDVPLGRYIDVMNGGPDDNWTASDFSTNQLMVSLLNAFGQPDTSFGVVDSGIPNGPLPGLL